MRAFEDDDRGLFFCGKVVGSVPRPSIDGSPVVTHAAASISNRMHLSTSTLEYTYVLLSLRAIKLRIVYDFATAVET